MHDHDTLNGKLLAWERPEEKHLRRKLGYWRMVEERMHRATLAAEGVDTSAPDFYIRMCRLIEQTHKGDTPYRDRHGLDRFGAIRQQAWFEQDAMVDAAKDAAIEALRKIEAGYNDPRSLAREILAMLPPKDSS